MKIPFDIKFRPQIECGEYKVVIEYDNRTFYARIVCWDFNSTEILACVNYGDREDVLEYDSSGKHIGKSVGRPDLIIITPEQELSEFEVALEQMMYDWEDKGIGARKIVAQHIKELRRLAREEIVKSGYVIEKKAFHDAVEKIDDKNKAEMSIQYSLHCKVENGTRHAVINWNEFQKVAQHFIDCGKAEALKALPRWEDIRNFAYSWASNDKTFYNDTLGQLFHKGKKLFIGDLERLPGFND